MGVCDLDQGLEGLGLGGGHRAVAPPGVGAAVGGAQHGGGRGRRSEDQFLHLHQRPRVLLDLVHDGGEIALDGLLDHVELVVVVVVGVIRVREQLHGWGDTVPPPT